MSEASSDGSRDSTASGRASPDSTRSDEPPGPPEGGSDGTDTETDSGSSRGFLGTWYSRIAWGVAALVVVLVVLFVLGIVGTPSAGLVDAGDWGAVTDERTEVVTTVWVDNPNPVGVAFGESLTVDYAIVMNGVVLAEGEQSDIAVPAGNSTERIRTDLVNDRLADWWVEFVRADETIELAVDGTLTVRAGPLGERTVPVEPPNRTILADDRPVVGALSASANATSGTYTESVEASDVDDTVVDDVGLAGDGSVTVGYEVRRGWATWGAVTDEETVVVFHLLVHNPGDVPVPAAPNGIGLAVDTNDVRLLETESDEFTLRSVGPDAVIQPGETREVTVSVTMDNERVDDWFTSHVREDAGPGTEATAVSSGFQVVFEEPATETTFRLPRDSPATYDCQFSTRILVDEQPVETTCGAPGGPTP
jgi:LEA14-like dessication related protein